MPKVFISGSINIKKLHPLFVERIANILAENMQIVVGDASGADTSIQDELARQMAEGVTVYCVGNKPRNNIGRWNVKVVQSSAKPGTRAFFRAKDVEMADVADFGLMLWDTASTGTLSNVFEILQRGKKCVVFVNKEQCFINAKEPNDILKLVAVMSEKAKVRADHKIGLHSKIFHLTKNSEQLELLL